MFGADVVEFGDKEVDIELLFYIERQHEPDLDNLVKFVLDALQLPFTVNGKEYKIINNDRRVMKIVAEKRFVIEGQIPSTTIKILPREVEIAF